MDKLLYSDTDSIYIKNPLDDSFISSNELGKLKLEFIADKAIFLSSKVYALQNYKSYVSKVKGLNSNKYLNMNNNSIEIVDDSIKIIEF